MNNKRFEAAEPISTAQYASGAEFWEDVPEHNAADFGYAVGADCLRSKLKTADQAEREFVRELFAAMQETRGFEPEHVVYPYSYEYAQDHGEAERFKRSREFDYECAHAICGVISDSCYEPNRYNHECAAMVVLNEYGFDRVNRLVAGYIQKHDRDGRISSANKVWAQDFPPLSDGSGVASALGQTHMILIDAFAKQTQKLSAEFTAQSLNLPADHGADVHEDYDLYRSGVFGDGHGFALGQSGNDSERCVVWEFDETDGVREYGESQGFYGERAALSSFKFAIAAYMEAHDVQIAEPSQSQNFTMSHG
jgi:hypothetical protein